MEDRIMFYSTAYLMFVFLLIAIIIVGAIIRYSFRRQLILDTSFFKHQIKNLKMATEEQWRQLMQSIDQSTNEVSAEIISLRDQIKGQGLPADVEETLFAGFTAAAERLKSVGKEPIPPTTGEGGSGTITGGEETTPEAGGGTVEGPSA